MPRNAAYIPQLEDGGPELSTALGIRSAVKSYALCHLDSVTDDWNTAAPDEEPYPRTGTTTFSTIGPSANQETDVRPEALPERVEAQIADMASSRPWDGDVPPVSIYVDPV